MEPETSAYRMRGHRIVEITSVGINLCFHTIK